MSGIKRTNANIIKQNEYKLKGITYLQDTDTTNIDNSLNIIGDLYINSTLNATGQSRLGNLITSGDVSLNSNVDVFNSLNVNGQTTLGNLITSGDVSLNSNVDVSGKLNVYGNIDSINITTSGNLIVEGLLRVDNEVSLNSIVDISSLNVNGITILNDDLILSNGDISLNHNLKVGGTSNFNGTVNIDGSLNVNESSYTYTITTINSVNLEVSDNIIKINVKDISTNQTTDVPSGIMVQDSSTNIFFGYSGKKIDQEHKDKFIITKTLYNEGLQSDISLSFDKSVDVFINGSLDISGGIKVANSLDVSGNVKIDGSLQSTSMIGFAYSVVGETNDLSSGEYPFSYGAGAYDQDFYFGYPILIRSNLVKVGILLSDSSMASLDSSINYVTFTINDVDVTFNWDDLSGYCQKNTTVYPIKDTNISYEEGDIVSIKCKELVLNNFNSRYDVVAVEKARIVMKFLTT